MYIINEWRERYEVNTKGQEAKPGDDLRSSPLKYIRSKVNGYSHGSGWRRLQELAKIKTPEIFGIFCKFLEIAGDQKADKRGILWNEKGEPATISDLSWITGFSKSQISNAFNILCSPELAWIIDDSIKIPGNSAELPEIPGAFINLTKLKGKELKGKEASLEFQDASEISNEVSKEENINHELTPIQKFRTAWNELIDEKYFDPYENKGIDVDFEAEKMESWIIANPDRVKKKYRPFINNWLGKCLDYKQEQKEKKCLRNSE